MAGRQHQLNKYLLFPITVQALRLCQVPPPLVLTDLLKPPAPLGCHPCDGMSISRAELSLWCLSLIRRVGSGLPGQARRSESKARDSMSGRESHQRSESAPLGQTKPHPSAVSFFHAGKYLEWPLLCKSSTTQVLCDVPDSPAQLLLSTGNPCVDIKRNLI